MAPFNGKSHPVDLLASLADDSPSLGWIQGDDGGEVTMVGDLQRLARNQPGRMFVCSSPRIWCRWCEACCPRCMRVYGIPD